GENAVSSPSCAARWLSAFCFQDLSWTPMKPGAYAKTGIKTYQNVSKSIIWYHLVSCVAPRRTWNAGHSALCTPHSALALPPPRVLSGGHLAPIRPLFSPVPVPETAGHGFKFGQVLPWIAVISSYELRVPPTPSPRVVPAELPDKLL